MTSKSKKKQNDKIDIKCDSYQIPQAGKQNKAGEDAVFVSKMKNCFGVFDGVGGWTKEGIDPSAYSAKLSEATREAYETENIKDPLKLMQYAYEQAKNVPGTSTACIAVIDGCQLSVANLGDSRLIVCRDQKVILCSQDQDIEWNMPYQIGTDSNMTPETHAKEYNLFLKPFDFIVLGSDGVFDNLSHGDILSLLKGENCQVIAKSIAEKAFTISMNQKAITPFGKEAKKFGKNWVGGKQDDISVVVVNILG